MRCLEGKDDVVFDSPASGSADSMTVPFGASYYPELIDECEWTGDLDNMKAAGLGLVRLLEFAWSRLEPREGEHDFAWLDRFLALVRERGMQAILGTPTATPPAWLTGQYPQMMIEMRDGTRLTYGERRAACVNSCIYRHFTEQIVVALALRYGEHEAVRGWQIDNELIGPELRDRFECHCPDCQWRFRDFLKKRYASLAELNKAWGLGFWSLEFSDWGEVQTPRCRRHCQGHVLDMFRFYHASQVDYIRLQYDLLRRHIAARQFVSHNSTGIFDRTINHLEYGRALDVAGWDAYRGAAAADHPRSEPFTALAHDLFRSALHKPFWIFETNTDGSQSKAYLAAARAHGAEAIVLWHWRRHRGNMEQTCPAMTDYAGKPHPERVALVRETKARLDALGAIPERLPKRQAAILYSVDCVRAQHRDAKRPMPYLDALIHLYEPFWRSGVGMDVLQPGECLAGYRLLAMPSLYLVSGEQAALIRDWVKQGGVLLACAKTGQQDLHALFYPEMAQPFGDLLGFRIGEDEPRAMNEDKPMLALASGEAHECQPWFERVENGTAEVLGTFTSGFAAGQPAVLKQVYGKGTVFYLAGFNADLCMMFAKQAALAAGLFWIDNPHPDVGIVPHLTEDKYWYFNHGRADLEVNGIGVPAGDFVVA